MLQRSPMYAYIPAKDVARARACYEKKLGFEPSERRQTRLAGRPLQPESFLETGRGIDLSPSQIGLTPCGAN
jgi:hypothetical protein